MSEIESIERRIAESEPENITITDTGPPLSKVVMHNDDYTPMEFVVAVLERFFNMERALAIRVMYEVHETGKAVCGKFSRDIAETLTDQVVGYARKHEHPLLCSIEV